MHIFLATYRKRRQQISVFASLCCREDNTASKNTSWKDQMEQSRQVEEAEQTKMSTSRTEWRWFDSWIGFKIHYCSQFLNTILWHVNLRVTGFIAIRLYCCQRSFLCAPYEQANVVVPSSTYGPQQTFKGNLNGSTYRKNHHRRRLTTPCLEKTPRQLGQPKLWYYLKEWFGKGIASVAKPIKYCL